MSIRVAGAEVISNSRSLINISGANGTYDDFYPPATSIAAGTLSMNSPLMTKTMTVNQFFGLTDEAVGRTALFKLDRSATGYTPTWTSQIYWPNGVEPTWTDHRYWLISLVSYDSTHTLAVASGHDVTAPETVSFAGEFLGILHNEGEFASVRYTVFGSGEILGVRTQGGSTINNEQDWITPKPPAGTYYARASLNSGQAPNAGNALDTWFDVDTNPFWEWTNSSGDREGDIIIDISTTASAAGIQDSAIFSGLVAFFGTA